MMYSVRDLEKLKKIALLIMFLGIAAEVIALTGWRPL
jgi:hypothetical protein